MADTFTFLARNIILTASVVPAALLNGSGSGVILRVKRIFILNPRLSTVTGVLGRITVNRITSITGGTAVTPTKHNPAQSDLPAQVVLVSSPTSVVNDTNPVLARQVWSSDEPAVGGATNDEWETIPDWNMVFEAGYGDTRVQPLTLREGYGVAVAADSNLTAGTVDVRIEFTRAAT